MGPAAGTGMFLPLRRTLVRPDSLCSFSHRADIAQRITCPSLQHAATATSIKQYQLLF